MRVRVRVRIRVRVQVRMRLGNLNADFTKRRFDPSSHISKDSNRTRPELTEKDLSKLYADRRIAKKEKGGYVEDLRMLLNLVHTTDDITVPISIPFTYTTPNL